MTPEESGKLGNDVRWHSLESGSPAGPPDNASLLKSGAVKREQRLYKLAKEAGPEAELAKELIEKIEAKEITKSDAYAILGFSKPQTEEKARTLLKKWNSNILDYLDRLEIKADEWLKEAASQRFEKELYS